MPLKIGDPAPNFALPNQHGKIVSLGDFAGRWLVLYFYPKDDTPGCTTEACRFSEEINAFEQCDAQILGVSADSPQSHRDFIEKYQLKIDLLSDPGTQMLQAYGVWAMQQWQEKSFMGISRRTFLIDPLGKVAHCWEAVKLPEHIQEVAQKLHELRTS